MNKTQQTSFPKVMYYFDIGKSDGKGGYVFDGIMDKLIRDPNTNIAEVYYGKSTDTTTGKTTFEDTPTTFEPYSDTDGTPRVDVYTDVDHDKVADGGTFKIIATDRSVREMYQSYLSAPRTDLSEEPIWIDINGDGYEEPAFISEYGNQMAAFIARKPE